MPDINFLTLFEQVGFPVAAAIASGVMVYVIMSKTLQDTAAQLDSVKTLVDNINAQFTLTESKLETIQSKVTMFVTSRSDDGK